MDEKEAEARPVMGTIFLVESERALRASERSERSEHIVVVSSRFYYNWRASEASETLFSHVYGNSR